MRNYLAIHLVMLALAAQPRMVPVLGWKPVHISKHHPKYHKARLHY